MAGQHATKSIANGKVQVTVYIPDEVADAARNAVVATTSYRLGYQSLSELAADAIAEKVSRLAKQFNNGRPFPTRARPLRPGRPIGLSGHAK